MKSNTGRNIRLGIFVTSAMLLFLLAAYLIGNDQSMFRDTFRLKTQFRNVSGLQVGNNVRFSGIHVGTVKTIEMVNDTTVEVEMVIEKKIREFIKSDARATIGSDGLVGSRVLNIVPGTGNAPVVNSGDYIPSYTKFGTEQMMSSLGTTSENVSLLTSRILDIAEDINSGKGTFGMLIQDTLTAYHLKETLKNLQITSERAAESMKDVQNFARSFEDENGLAYTVLKDTAMAGSFRRVMQDLESSGQKIREVSDALEQVSAKLKQENGALNYLTSDEEMVEQLKTILNNVEQGTEKFDENMKALQEHVLFRGYFKRQERKNNKQ